jgi:uncharacterized membrane protein YfcA
MIISMNELLFLITAGLIAGTMNAVAGGGTFVSLPAMVAAGVPALNANASSTVALMPGGLASSYAYRNDFRSFEQVSMRVMLTTSLVGGLAGALLLMFTPTRTFDSLVPWLLLLGTLAFAFGRQAGEWMRARMSIGSTVMLSCQFLLGIYGGYFGGGVGIMMMATWSLLGDTDIWAMSAARTLIVSATNLVAAGCFIAGGLIFWPQTLIMLAAAVAGGYFGARAARILAPAKARILISCINFTMTAIFFWREFG